MKKRQYPLAIVALGAALVALPALVFPASASTADGYFQIRSQNTTESQFFGLAGMKGLHTGGNTGGDSGTGDSGTGDVPTPGDGGNTGEGDNPGTGGSGEGTDPGNGGHGGESVVVKTGTIDDCSTFDDRAYKAIMPNDAITYSQFQSAKVAYDPSTRVITATIVATNKQLCGFYRAGGANFPTSEIDGSSAPVSMDPNAAYGLTAGYSYLAQDVTYNWSSTSDKLDDTRTGVIRAVYEGSSWSDKQIQGQTDDVAAAMATNSSTPNFSDNAWFGDFAINGQHFTISNVDFDAAIENMKNPSSGGSGSVSVQ